MSTRKVWSSGAWVTVGGIASDQGPGAVLTDGVDAATSVRALLTVAASATPHTEGAWVEIDPSLSAAASGIFLYVAATSVAGADSSTLLEIGTGAGGSEVVWATIGVGYASIFTQVLPGAIPAGTRVAVRCRSVIVSKTVFLYAHFLPVKSVALGAPVTYQANIATSRGLSIANPGSLNTKGNWTELVASTAVALSALSLWPQGGTVTNMAAAGVLLDIGIGAAASEVVIIPDVYFAANASEAYARVSPTTYGVAIPVGTRIAARYARASANNALDLILTGA